MESTIENYAGVLAPLQQDAIAAETNTPVAKKTRRATRKRMDSTVDESLLHSGPPKTPGTPGSRTLASETPRRSCRKSVRPPIDYEDIVRSAKKLISDEVDAQEEGEQPAVQKWNVAEVGKNTRKRNRKSKRLTSKKLKAEDEPESTGIDGGVKGAEVPIEQPGDKQSAVEEPQAGDKQSAVEEPQAGDKQSAVEEPQAGDKLEHLQDVKAMQPENELEQSGVKETQTGDKLEHLQDVKEMQPENKLEQSGIEKMQPEVIGVLPDVQDESQKPQQAGDVVKESEMPDSKSKNKAGSRKSSRVTRKADTSASSTLKNKRITKYKHIVGDEDIEELGVTPLDAETCEEDTGENQMIPLALVGEFAKMQDSMPKVAEQAVLEEEMPLQPLNTLLLEDEEMASLVMLDDDDEAEKPQLNTTFDADNIKQEDQSVILVDSPVGQSVGEAQKPSIKVVLTTTDDKTETLLNLKHASQKPKGYPFSTPFITKVDLSDSPEPSGSDQNKLEAEPRYERRRSKSASRLDDMSMSRTVTFRNTPIEIVNVADIDKRWKEAPSTKNVTNRRRRSKSLDERSGFTSRLPKPRIQPLPKPKPVTPSQVKKRTKLPDFSALHQKEFAKMESLVDHVERKAERAKILTTSALKKPPGSAAKKAQSSSAAERAPGARPKALKKIDMAADRTVVAENPDKKLPPSRLPLKNAANVTAEPRPAFNLSTATVKTFNATFSSKTAESQKDKLAERRQRHMDMFKGRAATKAQDRKSEFIRGVRLNRRFELQMQHRKHLDED